MNPSRAVLVAAVAMIGLLAVGLVVGSRLIRPDVAAPSSAAPPTTRTGPVALVSVDAPQAASASCSAVVAAMPAVLTSGNTSLSALPIAAPAPVGALAWGDRVADPVVLRCGLGKPPELTPESGLREVSGVRWLPVAGAASATWFVVDRPVYLALTLPEGVGTGPLQVVSEVVGATLPRQEVRP